MELWSDNKTPKLDSEAGGKVALALMWWDSISIHLMLILSLLMNGGSRRAPSGSSREVFGVSLYYLGLQAKEAFMSKLRKSVLGGEKNSWTRTSRGMENDGNTFWNNHKKCFGGKQFHGLWMRKTFRIKTFIRNYSASRRRLERILNILREALFQRSFQGFPSACMRTNAMTEQRKLIVIACRKVAPVGFHSWHVQRVLMSLGVIVGRQHRHQHQPSQTENYVSRRGRVAFTSNSLQPAITFRHKSESHDCRIFAIRVSIIHRVSNSGCHTARKQIQ